MRMTLPQRPPWLTPRAATDPRGNKSPRYYAKPAAPAQPRPGIFRPAQPGFANVEGGFSRPRPSPRYPASRLRFEPLSKMRFSAFWGGAGAVPAQVPALVPGVLSRECSIQGMYWSGRRGTTSGERTLTKHMILLASANPLLTSQLD